MKLRTLKPAVRSLPTAREHSSSNTWRSGLTTAARGYGGRWQRARLLFLQANPLCVFCERVGRVELASVVDHILPHRGDQDLFWIEGSSCIIAIRIFA